ncbi:MAG: phage virion morphogenesis protein [Candidatus Hydrogenedens sp.]|nr:phage virion morphogenesis protein [Candidatus Hydrogenedens sp.]
MTIDRPGIQLRMQWQGLERAASTLSALMARVAHRGVILRAVGEALVTTTKLRFEKQQSPDGQAWQSLAPITLLARAGDRPFKKDGRTLTAAAARRSTGAKILLDRGHLWGSIHAQLQGDAAVAVGSNLVYGRIHQLGGTVVPKTARALAFRAGGKLILIKKSVIPARPWLGFGPEETRAVEATVAQFLVPGLGRTTEVL